MSPADPYRVRPKLYSQSLSFEGVSPTSSPNGILQTAFYNLAIQWIAPFDIEIVSATINATLVAQVDTAAALSGAYGPGVSAFLDTGPQGNALATQNSPNPVTNASDLFHAQVTPSLNGNAALCQANSNLTNLGTGSPWVAATTASPFPIGYGQFQPPAGLGIRVARWQAVRLWVRTILSPASTQTVGSLAHAVFQYIQAPEGSY